MAEVVGPDAVCGFLDRADALHEAADTAVRDLVRKQRLLVSVATLISDVLHVEVARLARAGL